MVKSPPWIDATTSAEGKFFCFCLTFFSYLLSLLRETASLVYYLCCHSRIVIPLPPDGDVIMSPESRACRQQCEPAEPLPVGLCALVAANCAAAHSVPISDIPAGAHRGNNRLHAHLAAAC